MMLEPRTLRPLRIPDESKPCPRCGEVMGWRGPQHASGTVRMRYVRCGTCGVVLTAPVEACSRSAG